ncbi:MAG: glycosyltransferase family 2 protein [Actinomycetota bacterium]|nr:glycosyltransferase family 2 protein [Actinomycetota bacterium]
MDAQAQAQAQARDRARASVAVVIVNANAGEFLEQTLQALDRQTVRPERVIVVDNASTDGSAERLEERHADVEVHRQAENLGFAGGNNLGVRVAGDCRWIALLNPDAFAEPDWLEHLVDASKANPGYSFFASRLLDASRPERLDGTGDVYHVSGLAWRRDHGLPVAEADRPQGEVFSPCAAAALYDRKAFLEVGGFDESFFCYFEDSDLSFRLRLLGHRCLYVPEAVVHHVGSATTGRVSGFTIYHSFRNEVWTWAKNMPRPLLLLYLPQHVLVNLLATAFYTAKGPRRAILAAQRDAIKGLPRVLRERRSVQARRVVSAKELRSLMSGGLGAYRFAVQRALHLRRARKKA